MGWMRSAGGAAVLVAFALGATAQPQDGVRLVDPAAPPSAAEMSRDLFGGTKTRSITGNTRQIQMRIALPVPFAYNSAAVPLEALATLDNMAATLQQNPDRDLIVEGHTDAAGDARYNEQLSLRRAESVKAYLVGRGIEPGRLLTMGFGEQQLYDMQRPLHEINRRVEFRAP